MNTPIALFCFNRPLETKKVFSRIAELKPKILLLVADGPRDFVEGESERCQRVREIISDLSWDCDVRMNFAEKNLGCRDRMASGLDWVFDQVPEAIILEDDCLPDATFFRFCEELLAKYRDNPKVMMISGDYFGSSSESTKLSSYVFSSYPAIWGWASWRRAWRKYDLAMRTWPEDRDGRFIENRFTSLRDRMYWKDQFDAVYSRRINTWDLQWVYSCWKQSGLAIHPSQNLVSNIGFGAEATHTKDPNDRFSQMPVLPIRFPLEHPNFVQVDSAQDAYLQANMYRYNYRAAIKYILSKALSKLFQ